MNNDNTNQDRSELFTALALAQGQFTPVETDKKVDFKTKGGGQIKYNYASFAAIFLMAQKPLSNNGLSILQHTQSGELITTLAHKSGQSISSFIPLPDANDIKQLGANLSYLRRYQYTSIIGIAIKEEDDERTVVGSISKPRTVAKKLPNPNIDQSTGEVITPTQAAGFENKPKGEAPDWPAKEGPIFEFCQEVRAKTNYYENQYHLEHTVGGFKGDMNKTDSNGNSNDNYQEKLSVAIDHARTKEAAQNG